MDRQAKVKPTNDAAMNTVGASAEMSNLEYSWQEGSTQLSNPLLEKKRGLDLLSSQKPL